MTDQEAILREVLADAARLGFLGPGPIEPALEHARGFLEVLRPAEYLVDLGSGGGLPGLVLVCSLPNTEVTLLDVSQRRTDVLQRSVGRLGLGDRVRVVCRRADEVGREPAWRASFDTVVARGFGPPGAVAGVAAPLLRRGGQLVVSEPPLPDPERWPGEALAELGLARDQIATDRYASFTQTQPCPDRYPLRHGKRAF